MRKILIFRDGTVAELFKGEPDFVLANALAKVTEGGVARRLDRTSLDTVEVIADERLPRTLAEFDEVCPDGADWTN